MMDRRIFLTTVAGGLLAAPLAAAQQAGKVYGVGILPPGPLSVRSSSDRLAESADYNTQAPHAALGFRSPADYRAEQVTVSSPCAQ